MEALSQIICVFGSEELKTAAKSYGKMTPLAHFVKCVAVKVFVNNNNNNNHDDIYSAVIMAEPLREFTRFTR